MNYKLYTQFLMNEADAGDTGTGGDAGASIDTGTTTTEGEGTTADSTTVGSASITGETGAETDSPVITLPTENSTDEERAAYREAIGVPASAADYDLSGVEIPDVFKESLGEDGFNHVKDWAFKNNVPAAAVSELISTHLNSELEKFNGSQSQFTEASDKAMADYKASFGSEDEFNAKMSDINTVINTYGVTQEELVAAGFVNNPAAMAIMGKVIADIDIKEDSVAGAGQGSKGGDLNTRLAEIQAHPGFMDRTHPQNKALQSENNEILKKLYPTS